MDFDSEMLHEKEWYGYGKKVICGTIQYNQYQYNQAS